MKKDFFKVSLLLTMAIICVLVFKYTEAAVTATIDASKTSTTVGSSPVTITYSSSGADSCKVYLGSTLVSSSSSGSLVLSTATAGTYTYSISCVHTVVVPTGTCKGVIVAGSTQCDGSGGEGPDEGISCSYFTTQEACNPSSCSSWFHHGCTWQAS